MKKRNGQTPQESPIWATDDTSGFSLSRRQFSLGVSGIVLLGTTGGVWERNVHASAAAISAPSACQIVTPQTVHHPPYILSETRGCVWSPDSRALATFREQTVTLYEARTGQEIVTYDQHTDDVLTVKWSPDSRYLASSGFDPMVHVWDATSGQTVTRYQGHTQIVREVAWSPNQRYLTSAGYDKTVQVWEAFTGSLLVTYTGHRAEIVALSWSPDNRMIASTDLQNTTMIWRLS